MSLAEEFIQVLAVACRMTDDCDGVEVTHVDTAAAALAAIRLMHFDVMVTGGLVSEHPVWSFIHRIRSARPKLAWWLVGPELSIADEVLARSLGLARLLVTVPNATEIVAAHQRRKQPAGSIAHLRFMIPAG